MKKSSKIIINWPFLDKIKGKVGAGKGFMSLTSAHFKLRRVEVESKEKESRTAGQKLDTTHLK